MKTSCDEVSFFEALFDLSFTYFVTPKLVKFVFVVALVVMTCGAVFFLLMGLREGGGQAIGSIFLVPLGYIAAVLYVRVILEMFVALIRVAENTAAIAEQGGKD